MGPLGGVLAVQKGTYLNSTLGFANECEEKSASERVSERTSLKPLKTSAKPLKTSKSL